MRLNRVRDNFAEQAATYDGFIANLIPRYNEQHALILSLIPFESHESIRVLDLGAGTGVLAHLILESFSNAQVTAYDLVQDMLDVCKQRFAPYGDRYTLMQGDFANDKIGSGYDVVLSGLAIHHLDNDTKRALFSKIFSALKTSGHFINRDIVLAPSPTLTKEYEAAWRAFIKQNGEDDAKWFSKYLEEDIPASVSDQLQWLIEAGFSSASCHWSYLNFAIFGGSKQN